CLACKSVLAPCSIVQSQTKPPGRWRLFWGRNSLDTTLPFLRQRLRKSKKVKVVGSVVHEIYRSRHEKPEQVAGTFKTGGRRSRGRFSQGIATARPVAFRPLRHRRGVPGHGLQSCRDMGG